MLWKLVHLFFFFFKYTKVKLINLEVLRLETVLFVGLGYSLALKCALEAKQLLYFQHHNTNERTMFFLASDVQ